MAEIELKFLGEFQVLQNGEVQKLPPSKKTRALLAYLSLNQQRFRREHLCELLWEIPDDPRGSLRWSLSKIRALVDDDDQRRVIADRNAVEFNVQGVTIDVLELIKLTDSDVTNETTETLEAAVKCYQGNFLEGLDLTNFHEYYGWHVAESARVTQSQERLLKTLVERLMEDSAKALPYAQSLVSLSPYSEVYRGYLIQLLVDLKRHKEAEQQFQLGMKILTEVNEQPRGIMQAALQGSGHKQSANEQVQVIEKKDALRSTPGSADLIGRDKEMSLLAGVFDEISSNDHARFVLITGEPGIGKSRLIDWIANYASEKNAHLLRASAYETETIRPFAMWIDALTRHDPEMIQEMFANKAGRSRDHLFDSLSRYVEQQCAERQTVLIFDDIHWSDESSAAALHYVARMNRERPILGILSARSIELFDNKSVQQVLRGLAQDGVLQEVPLASLSQNSVKSLIQRVAPNVDAEPLSRHCNGNPLFAIELARAEQQGGSSQSLSGLIRQRLARMDAASVEVLRWAAMLSPRIDINRLMELTGVSEEGIGIALEAAEQYGMLSSTLEGLTFSHTLVVRSIYNDISSVRRQVMHRRIANLIEENSTSNPTLAAELSHHAINSGDAKLGARALARAGQMCLRFFANEEALSLARRGLELAKRLDDSERVCVSLDLHNVRLSAAPLDDWQSAAEKYANLAELALDYGHMAHARLGYQMASFVRWAHGQWGGAREESLQAERIARSGSEQEHIVGLAEAARCLAMLERDLPQADAMVMEAEAMACRQKFNYFALPIASGILRYHENQLEEAEELLKDARTQCKSVGDRISEYQANEYLVMIEIQRGAYSKALEQCQELIRIGDNLREGSEAPFAYSIEGLCIHAIQGDQIPLNEALKDLRRVDAKYRLSYVQSRAALIDFGNKCFRDAIKRATESLECARLLERPTETLLSHLILQHAHQAMNNTKKTQLHERKIAQMNLSRVSAWARNTMNDFNHQTAGVAHG